jgi:hypothetical protein
MQKPQLVSQQRLRNNSNKAATNEIAVDECACDVPVEIDEVRVVEVEIEVEQAFDHIREVIKSQLGKNNALKLGAAAMEAEQKNLSTRLAAAEADKDLLQRSVETSQGTTSRLEATVQQLKIENDGLRQTVTDLHARLSTASAATEEVTRLREQVTELEAENAEFKKVSRIVALQNENQKLKSELLFYQESLRKRNNNNNNNNSMVS